MRQQRYANINDASLRQLSENEKLQMVELARTRERIVSELRKFPSSQIDQNFAHTQPWHHSTSASMEQGLQTFKSQTVQLPRLVDNRITAKPRRRNHLRQQGRVSHSASTAFISELRTGLTMAPIMATSGDFVSEIGLGDRKGGKDKMRLPIFRLPTIDVTQFSAEKQRSALSATLGTADGVRNTGTFIGYADGKGFCHAMSLTLRALSPRERGFLLQNLRVTEADLADVLERLDRTPDKRTAGAASMSFGASTGDLRVGSADASSSGSARGGGRAKLGATGQRRGVFDLGAFFAVDSSAGGSCFMKARSGDSEGLDPRQLLSSAGGAAASAVDLSPPVLGLSADFQRFMALGSTAGSVSVPGARPKQPSDWAGRGSAAQQVPLAARSSRRNPGTGRARAQTGGNINGRNEAADSQELTRALIESLREMDKHSKMIKRGIETAQDLLVGSGGDRAAPRGAKTLVLTVASERMQPALHRIVVAELRRGFAAWLLSVRMERRLERVGALFRFLVVRNVVLGLSQLIRKVLRQAIVLWREVAARETQRLQRERVLQSVLTIQKLLRRRLATKTCAALKQRRKYQRLYDATVRIQALMRGAGTRWRYLRSRVSSSKETASVVVQKYMRSYLARKRVYSLRLRRNRALAATSIQAIARGRIARRRVVEVRAGRRQHRGAVQIQRIVRGFVSRRTISTILVNRARYKYAVRIQALMRGALTRMNRERNVADLQEYRYGRFRAATRAQAAYRGYRSRLLFRMKLYKLRKARSEQARAATVVTTLVRGFLCRALLRDLRKERHEEWVAGARQWQEMWSDESSAWFYLNVSTGDALWEPSSEGYVKFDGSLVLASGDIIEDPRNRKETDAEGGDDGGGRKTDKKKQNNLCSECSDRLAIRACHECGDKFCTKCYKATHATGSRRNHTYSAVGPLDCTECEMVLAERWCVSCDEAYCDGCWRKVHSRGKRRFHPYSEVSPAGRVDARIFTMDGEQQLQGYDASYAQQQLELANGQAAAAGDADYSQQLSAEYAHGAEEGAEEGEWVEYADEQGYPYWYSSVSGESTYDCPY